MKDLKIPNGTFQESATKVKLHETAIKAMRLQQNFLTFHFNKQQNYSCIYRLTALFILYQDKKYWKAL